MLPSFSYPGWTCGLLGTHARPNFTLLAKRNSIFLCKDSHQALPAVESISEAWDRGRKKLPPKPYTKNRLMLRKQLCSELPSGRQPCSCLRVLSPNTSLQNRKSLKLSTVRNAFNLMIPCCVVSISASSTVQVAYSGSEVWSFFNLNHG